MITLLEPDNTPLIVMLRHGGERNRMAMLGGGLVVVALGKKDPATAAVSDWIVRREPDHLIVVGKRAIEITLE